MSNAKRLYLQQQRETLPIASFREEIVNTLKANQVLVLSGETGCGKSTQLPSFILEDHLSQGLPCKIYVTEPRRISAISLAERVSRELGDKGVDAAGAGGGLVGYSIRLESKIGRDTVRNTPPPFETQNGKAYAKVSIVSSAASICDERYRTADAGSWSWRIRGSWIHI